MEMKILKECLQEKRGKFVVHWKSNKLYLRLTPSQFSAVVYKLYIFPQTVFTFRFRGIKFNLLEDNKTLQVTDGVFQIYIISEERNIIYGLDTSFLDVKVGGTFEEKECELLLCGMM